MSFIFRPTPMVEPCAGERVTVLEAMERHDANEERRYLREGRLNVTWSWLWLTWQLGVGGDVELRSDERCSVWLSLGPLTIEAYWRPS